MNRTATLAAAALALCAVTGSTSAGERPNELVHATMRVVGHAIASQGNAALIQIRQELKQSALESIRQYLLPAPAAPAAPARTAKR
jgi:hypothetical protein